MALLRTTMASIVAALAALAGAAHADPVAISSGAAQLPTSGLVIDLPVKPAISYKVSGSWSLDDSAPSYDTRDIIDEYDTVSGALVAGNWVLVGYFTAGGCEPVLNAETLDKAWMTDTTLWGETWKVRGGIYTFTSDLGRRPAAILCRSIADGQSLVLYRYLVDQPEALTQSAIMNDVARAGVLAAASKSYSTGRTADIFPLRRSETRNRGKTEATRTVTLKTSGLTVAFPDDGYVWLPTVGDSSDFLNRMSPTLPVVSLEVTTVPGMTCDEFLSQLQDQKPDMRARNLPAGWQAGPTVIVDGADELTTCTAGAGGSKLIGFFLPPGQSDVTALKPIITAIGNAQ